MTGFVTTRAAVLAATLSFGCRAVVASQPAPRSDTSAAARRLILGRVVNLAARHRETTLTDLPPDEERTDSGSDFGVVILPNGTLDAYQLSTSERLWSKASNPPCRRLTLGPHHVYAECGGKLVAFGRSEGASKIVEPSGRVKECL